MKRTNAAWFPRTAPPFYGWRIVWALALTQTLGYGALYYAFGVLVRPMEAELGWTRAQSSGAFSLGLLVAGLAAVPIGRLVDRRGARGLMALGSLLGAGLLFVWAQVHSLPALYAVWAGLGLAMAATLYEVAFTVVAVWFRRQRARAIFAITMVAGLASTVFVPLTTLLVAHFGWRGALEALALILAMGAVPLHALVLRRAPSALGLRPDGEVVDSEAAPAPPEASVSTRAAVASAGFWWFAGAFGLARLAFAAMGAHLVPLLQERGYGAGFVALAVGAIGPLQLLGRVAFVPLERRLSLRALSAAMFGLLGLAFALLLTVPGPAGVGLFVLLYGSANGASTLTRAALQAELYGPAHYGQIGGVVALLVAVLGALAPVAAGVLYASSGGYGAVLWSLVLTGLVGAGAMWGVRRPGDG